MKPLRLIALLILTALLGGVAGIMGRASVSAQPTQPVPTAQAVLQDNSATLFTYQGYLTDNGQPANGSYDFQFRLFDAATNGTEVSTVAVVQNDVTVTSGIFVATLNMGDAVFTGALRYLDISVRPGASTGSYTTLAPRQPLTPSPYALRAGRLALPYSDTATTSRDLISLKNEGTGGVLHAEVSANSDSSAISTTSFGSGYALKIDLNNANNTLAALYARTNGSGQAIDAEVNSATSEADALFARTTSTNSESYAGSFAGKVKIDCSPCNDQNSQPQDALTVIGSFTASSKAFKIDHPLDPANKYLYHTSVESPDMKNIYDGVVTLGADGSATVTMPDWFEALNMGFRYQLTAIGAPGPDLYIAQKVKQNQFVIAGGTPGMEVSWQLTGIRHDAYANAHRTPVEQDKPASERGRYLDPEALGQPASLQVSTSRASDESSTSPAITP